MPNKPLSNALIQSLAPRQEQYEVPDSKVSGFAIRVSPGGTKSFVLLYRVDGRQRRLTLGKYPALSLSDARTGAREALTAVAKGRDPAAEKRERAHSATAFEAYVETFIELYAKPKNKSYRETERLLKKHFVKAWRRRDIRTIKRSDVARVIDKIMEQGTPSAAKQAFAVIRKLFNWAVSRGHLDVSPCTGMSSPAPATSRDRVLSNVEIRRIWQASGTLGYPFGPYVRMLFLTAQRRSEVAGMKWSQIDFKKKLWTLPKTETKSKREHVVPLSATAITLLKSLPHATSDFVFPAQKPGEGAMSGFSKRKRKLDKVSGTSGWTLHDIRRTVATQLAALKVEPHVIERVLNHTTGTLGGVAGVYNRFAYLPEMAEALNKWAAHLEAHLKSVKEDVRQPELA